MTLTDALAAALATRSIMSDVHPLDHQGQAAAILADPAFREALEDEKALARQEVIEGMAMTLGATFPGRNLVEIEAAFDSVRRAIVADALAHVVWWPDREALTAALAEALDGMDDPVDACRLCRSFPTVRALAAAIVAAMLPEKRP